jgi:ParB/RepB/Spo0J family partition protein
MMSELTLPLDAIEPDPDQVRRDFPYAEIEARAKSIRKFGQLYPVIVRPIDEGKWMLVDGEMRWRAMQMLNKKEPDRVEFSRIRAVERDGEQYEGDDRLAVQLAANDQRKDLTPYERVVAVSKLQEAHGKSELQEALGITDGQMRLLREIADAPDYVWEYGATRRYPKKENNGGRGRPAKGWVQCEPLGITHLREVADLAKKLRAYDEERQRMTEQRHVPVAEKESRRIAEAAQRGNWSVAQVRTRCAAVRDKYLGDKSVAEPKARPVFSRSDTRLTVDLNRIAEAADEERRALEAALTEVLARLRKPISTPS